MPLYLVIVVSILGFVAIVTVLIAIGYLVTVLVDRFDERRVHWVHEFATDRARAWFGTAAIVLGMLALAALDLLVALGLVDMWGQV